jgi:hypothetical protein
MVRQHNGLWNAMRALDGLLAADAEAGGLLALLDQHNSKEEPIIYPQADKKLDAAASAKLSAFLEAGRGLDLREGGRLTPPSRSPGTSASPLAGRCRGPVSNPAFVML